MKKPPTKITPVEMPMTRWSLIGRAGARGEFQREAMEAMLRLYSPVLLAVLVKRLHFNRPAAEDLLQGFIADRVLEKEIIAHADRTVGKFRTFLLTALNNYAIDQHRRRGRDAGLNEPLEAGVEEAAATRKDPRALDDLEWARHVVRLTLERMERYCEQTKRRDLWLVFDGRVAGPAMESTEPRNYGELASEAGLTTPMEAMNALVTAKRMFRRVLEEVVAEYVDDPADIEAEVSELLAALGGGK
jgi:DNA-directed RNA polymerase specialized sigma24 family protein